MRASFCSGFLFRVDSRDLAKKKPVVNNSLLPGAKPNAYELEKICSVDCWCCSRHRACARSDPENPPSRKDKAVMTIQLTSSVFAEGEFIPAKYTCDGEDVSPPLKWSNVPSGAKGLALICDDPD